MTEKQLFGTIKELRQIKPREDWVVFTKSQILGEELETKTNYGLFNIFPRFIFQYKPAFATLAVLCILAATFVSAQNSLPGDALYSVKKITEKGMTMLASESERPNMQLTLTNKRLEELNNIAKTNQIKKLAPAIQEFQTNASQAAKGLAQAKQPDVKQIKQIADATKKIEESKQKAEALGVVVGDTKELDDALAKIVEKEISDLETRILNESQAEVLKQAKESFEAADYSAALEKILILNNPQ
jgi:hypothetical protein